MNASLFARIALALRENDWEEFRFLLKVTLDDRVDFDKIIIDALESLGGVLHEDGTIRLGDVPLPNLTWFEHPHYGDCLAMPGDASWPGTGSNL